MAYLEITKGSDSGESFELTDEVYLGRSTERSNTSDYIVLRDEETSRYHARLQKRNAHYFIEDLNSTNGTILRDKRVLPNTPYRLQDGDTIKICSFALKFSLAPGEAAIPQNPLQTGIFPRDNPYMDGMTQSPTAAIEMISDELDPPEMSVILDATSFGLNADSVEQHHLQFVIKRLEAVSRISIALGSITDQRLLMERVMDYIFDIYPNAERAFVMLKDPADADRLKPIAFRELEGSSKITGQRSISSTIVNKVVSEKHAILSVNAMDDERFKAHDSVLNLSIRSLICAPLLVDNEVLGLIQVENFSNTKSFNDEDLHVLAGISTQVGIAAKNASLYNEIERLFEGFVTASVHAIESRDPSTAGHSFRVASFTELLATATDRCNESKLKKVAFDREQIQEIRYAALLHDFGKVGVRENVLTKSKKLYPDRLDLIKHRFRIAKMSLERRLYLELINQHEKECLSPEKFAARKQEIEKEIQFETSKIDGFLKTIILANEPTVSDTSAPKKLEAIKENCFCNEHDKQEPLLHEFEFEDLILMKGTLNHEERTEIESHVSHTFEFLSLIPWTSKLANLPEITYGHHEKLDGSGYPNGLKADQIPVQTRIITITDIYDALTAGDRPYKPGLPHEMALDVLQEEAKLEKIDRDLFKVFVESRAFELGGIS